MGRTDAGGMSLYAFPRGLCWFHGRSGVPHGGLFEVFFILCKPCRGQEFEPGGGGGSAPYQQHSPSYHVYPPEFDSQGGVVPARVAMGAQLFAGIDS